MGTPKKHLQSVRSIQFTSVYVAWGYTELLFTICIPFHFYTPGGSPDNDPESQLTACFCMSTSSYLPHTYTYFSLAHLLALFRTVAAGFGTDVLEN